MSIPKIQQAHFQGKVRSRKEKERTKEKETHNTELTKCPTVEKMINSYGHMRKYCTSVKSTV